MSSFAKDFKAAMDGWDLIMQRAREQFPDATPERLYEIAEGAMKHALRGGGDVHTRETVRP
jgi:hypothetical protein